MKIRYFFLLVLAGCASQRYENDRTDPNYQSNHLAPIVPTGGADMAAVGVIASGIALAANRNYYKATAITGQVLCRASGSDVIEIPCNNVDLTLSDMRGKEIARTQTRNGEFAFRVEKDASYALGVSAPGYSLASKLPTRSSLGDDVVVRLRRNP